MHPIATPDGPSVPCRFSLNRPKHFESRRSNEWSSLGSYILLAAASAIGAEAVVKAYGEF